MNPGLSNFIIEKLREYPGVEIKPHFEKLSLRWKNKIWITWTEGNPLICLKLSFEDQEVFTRMSRGSVYPVPNKWGGHGWTNVDCSLVGKALISDILLQSMIHLDAKSDHSFLVTLLHQIHES